MTLDGYLKIFRQRWLPILICALVAATVMFVATPAKPPNQPAASSYTGTATLLVGTSSAGASSSLGRVALYVTKGEVPRIAAEKLGYTGDPALLAGQLEVTPDSATESVTIAATGVDGQVAADRANAFAEATVNYLADPGIMILQAASPIANQATGGVVVPPSRGSRTLLGAIAGLLLGLALAIVLDHLDRRLRTRQASHEALGLPVVAEVPRLPHPDRQVGGILVSKSPLGAYADGYRAARSALMHLPSKPLAFDGSARTGRSAGQWGQDEAVAGSEVLSRATGKVVMITSAFAGEGKTTSVANLAASFAEAGQRVLVVDADLRSPTVHQLFDVPQGAGVSDFLIHPEGASLSSLVRATSIDGVGLVTAGTKLEHPTALTNRMGPLISAAREIADVVLVDAAPILGASDGFDLFPVVDTVLLVVRSGRLTTASAQRVAEVLGRFQVPVAGVVVIGAPSDGGDGYGDGMGSGLNVGQNRRILGREQDKEAVPAAAASASGRTPGDGESDRPPRRVTGSD